MTTPQRHYDDLLAPIYVWMAGGLQRALAAGAEDVAPFASGGSGKVAIDLGAGFGMHAIPLARRGFAVKALDTSQHLLSELRAQAEGLDIEAILADLLDFRAHVEEPADLILCMGDTLTHLDQLAHVERLLGEAAAALTPEGRLVLTFRDYTHALTGDARFLPVRSDGDRIHTCFLEEAGDRMIVHDLLHEREGEQWRLRVSSYPKLRIAPDWLVGAAGRAGLTARIEPGPRGMVRVVARSDFL